MRILVTGAAGFIGYHVTRALLARGDIVIGVDSLTEFYDEGLKQARLSHIRSKNFTFIKADISDRQAMETVFKNNNIDRVCHLAAQAGVRYSLSDPFTYEHSNNLGTLTLLELCKNHKMQHFIFASSSSVYGNNKKMPFSEQDKTDNQVSIYAATKKYTEVLAHVYHTLYGINCTGLRFFTVYGPYMRPDLAPFKFVRSITEGRPIEVYNNGKHKRDFTYVDDIVQGVLAAIDKSYPYEIINLGRGQSVTLMRFISVIERELGITAKKQMLPKQQGDVAATSADIRKAKKLLKFSPKTGIDEGMKRFIAWYKEHYHVK